MNIAIFDLKPWEKKMFDTALKGHKLSYFESDIDNTDISKFKNAEIISCFVTSQMNKQLIDSLPKLKFIATRSTGFDNIDVQEAAQNKIKVSNVPTYGENTVAEHAFALILTLSRNIQKAYERTKKNKFSIEGLMGFDLEGKTLGVVGCGHIGKHVVRIAKGFGMKTLIFDKSSKTTLNELLSNSDIISLHLPACKATHHIIDAKNIKRIKKGAILINTARGSLIDTKALLSALNTGILAGAGLDVLEDEELLSEEHHLARRHNNSKKLLSLKKDHKLLAKENVIYTPHIAFYSQEAVNRITKTTIDNILAFIKKKPINLVEIKTKK